MLNLIEPLLNKRELDYVRLDGSVPQKKRQDLIHQFQKDSECKLFITTNAGSTGLNLQAANTVINIDLPWNPAVLEQRIGRAHRMGQKRPVQIFLLGYRGYFRGRSFRNYWRPNRHYFWPPLTRIQKPRPLIFQAEWMS